jgi:hypothetical protein
MRGVWVLAVISYRSRVHMLSAKLLITLSANWEQHSQDRFPVTKLKVLAPFTQNSVIIPYNKQVQYFPSFQRNIHFNAVFHTSLCPINTSINSISQSSLPQPAAIPTALPRILVQGMQPKMLFTNLRLSCLKLSLLIAQGYSYSGLIHF